MRRVVMACAFAASLLRLVACGSFSGDSSDAGASNDAAAPDATASDGSIGAKGDAQVVADANTEASADAGDAGWLCSSTSSFGNFATLLGLNALGLASAARLTADELTLYFQANPSGSDYGVFVSTRATITSPWSTPVTLANVDLTNVSEGSPSPFPDGLSLVFEDDRNTMGQGTWFATRPTLSASFTVQSAPLAQTSGVQEGQPFYDPIQQRVYFISNSSARSGLIGGYDVIQGDLVVNVLKNVKSVPGINSTVDDSHPSLSADALSIYFASMRGGPQAVWVAQRSSLSDGFGAPVLAGDFDSDMIPSWFSPDGCRVYATRLVDGGTQTELVIGTRPPM